ncbi:conodipine-P3-like [Haliotis rubra]|uniref:conodipine-P3-like n=1 Tax=Haliotis rubra TaxID=36100 RepID=UPI001EE5B0A7|nr:conodipine-P3-like [Haliotis rubra]
MHVYIQLIQGLSVALGVVSVTSSGVCARYDVNGCSTPLRLPFFFKTTFTPACNRHDMCYRCGYRYKITRYICDQVFHGHMYRTCSDMSWLKRKLCQAFAMLYYKAVKRFGLKRYREPSSWYCHHPWVPKCLPFIRT